MNILLVSSSVPRPGEAGSPRTYHLAESLQRRHRITLLLLSGDRERTDDASASSSWDPPFSHARGIHVPFGAGSPVAKLLNALAGYPWFATRLMHPRVHAEAVKAVRELCSDADVIWADGLFVLQFVEGCGLPVLIDEIDYMSRLSFAQAGSSASRLSRLEGLWRSVLIRRYERRHLPKAQAVTLISTVDAAQMAEQIEVEAKVIMNGCDTAFFSPRAEPRKLPGSPSIVFVGNYRYQPNNDAAQYIIDDLSRSLAVAFPGVKIYLVGPPPEGGFGTVPKSVEAVGFVDDVRDYYEGADVFLSPLRFGTGVKNKILEAAAMECPIVASSLSVEGIAFEDHVHFLRADTTTEYAERIAEMLSEGAALRRSMVRSARELIHRSYSWEAEAAKLESLLETAARSGQPS